jgi:hypothetical protein
MVYYLLYTDNFISNELLQNLLKIPQWTVSKHKYELQVRLLNGGARTPRNNNEGVRWLEYYDIHVALYYSLLDTSSHILS